MPELAEVELARRIWEPGLGKNVLTVETHPRTRVFRDTPARSIESALSDKTLSASRAHGKRLLFSFSDSDPAARATLPGTHLELHLGMAGRLFLAPPDYEVEKHDHFVLRLPDLALVYSDYRQFGRVFLHPLDRTREDPWADLPPQPLDRQFNLRHVTRLVERRRATNIKALLLDQASFPGVGNWMADEICWRLPCHPGTAAGALDPARVRTVARQVCRGAMRHVAEKNRPRDGTEGFSPGRYVEQVPPPSWLFQHRWKAGGTCPRCRSGLERSTVASRTTAWCPRCQPGK